MKKWFVCLALLTTSISNASEQLPLQLSVQEQPALTLYYAPWCYYSQKVLNYLKRIGKTVPLKDVDTPLFQEELIRFGGKKQVPCLLIDETALYESNDIIAWLSAHQDLLGQQNQ